MEEVTIEKLVHGGQGLGMLADGRRVFVWNALPGERVLTRVIKKKRSYVEAVAEEIIEASPERIVPDEENYLATSPWQMMTFAAENKYKRAIVEELFAHEKVILPEFGETIHDERQWQYRNKMEYSFWGDDDGLHLALYRRGSHGKQIVTGSKLAMPEVDMAANAMLQQIQKHDIRAGELKTIIVRSAQNGATVASLFVKSEVFPKLNLPDKLQGLRVYYSNPKSPASVQTKLLYELGSVVLEDRLLDKQFQYDVDSFFQVNLPLFERALERIKAYRDHKLDVTDMYAGVGSIGLSIAPYEANLIELDPATASMARSNAAKSKVLAYVTETSTEKALEYIVADRMVIFDPPRAGLHAKVTEKVLEVCPPKVMYLSCNPATHARDLARLQEKYDITHFEVFNFFPRTPHIETLAILLKRS